ncbi:hypothetical protein ACKI1I_35085 [Streptomyces turgidiscabies]|uniref:Uncharacterized protein n=2 Tax=Streptomyces TaxID=1883 RepID=L7F0X2_STRT8|nr:MULTISPECIES: hypothetical protein [Streptomyces]ELP64235.1 hypothetical protein STRTUCAR8_04621 [Streptomyces turgidiscabies Car8]MDX3495703.1 hypothetical protein [Streptomyces turgidiscabies]GAQ75523.1 hypothetical protein T45_07308 [Streptomyces turgidiscabies]
MAEQSKGEKMLQEPMLRPAGMRFPALDVVRSARVFADGKTLVVRDRRGGEKRYPVGGEGIRGAVFFPPADIWETTMKHPAARWGVLVFVDADGRYVLQIPLAHWLPEAGVVGTAQLRPMECLSRTGLKQLIDELRVPMTESETPWGREVFASPGGGRYDWAGSTGQLLWHNWVRGIGIFGWFIALVFSFSTGGKHGWGFLVAAIALFLVPGSDVFVCVLAWWRTRGDGRLAHASVITPSPEPGAGATRRFRETATVRILHSDVVLTNTVGDERWYARGGTHGIARLVRLTHPKTRAYLGVELRDGDGKVRGLLPWRWWFAGSAGEQRWAEFVEALPLPVSEEIFRHANNTRHAENPDSWWEKHELGRDAERMAPMYGKVVRRATSWNAVKGANEKIVIPIFGALLLAGLFSEDGLARVVGIFSALTIAAVLGPVLLDQVTSRFSYDRPDAGEPS